MPPFTADPVRPRMNFIIDDYTPAAPGAKDDTEYNAISLGGAQGGFGQGKTIGIIFHKDRNSQLLFQIFPEWLPDQTNCIAVFHFTASGINGAGRTNADWTFYIPRRN